MNDHLTPEKLRALVHGELGKVEVRRILGHLAQGCRSCDPLLAPLFASLAEREVPGATEVPGRDETIYDAPIRRAWNSFLGEKRRHERQQAKVRQRLPQVRAARTSAELLAAGIDRIEGWASIEALLGCAYEMRHDDPERMVLFAEHAKIWVEKLPRERLGDMAVADLQARTWGELGNAYRVADRLSEAEDALQTALERVEGGSGDRRIEARILDFLASLRASQRCFDEAQGLLDRVHTIYKAAGEDHLAGRALVSKGLCAGHDHQPELALQLVTQGLELIDRNLDPKLTLAAVHAKIRFLVDLGQHRRARRELFASRGLYRRDGDAVNLMKLAWVEGQIAAGMGELESAERRFRQVRKDFRDMKLLYKAALVELDLALVLLQQGKSDEVFALVEEMIATFRSMRISREALSALLVLRNAGERERLTLEVVQTVAAFLQTLEQDPTAQFDPGRAV